MSCLFVLVIFRFHPCVCKFADFASLGLSWVTIKLKEHQRYFFHSVFHFSRPQMMCLQPLIYSSFIFILIKVTTIFLIKWLIYEATSNLVEWCRNQRNWQIKFRSHFRTKYKKRTQVMTRISMNINWFSLRYFINSLYMNELIIWGWGGSINVSINKHPLNKYEYMITNDSTNTQLEI